MWDEKYVYIIIPTYNCVDKLEETINSIYSQTYDLNAIRVLFMDNGSTDGTYEVELRYITQRPNMFSIVRLDSPTTIGRLLKRAVQSLRFSDIHYSTLLYPGDVLYPNYIYHSVRTMNLSLNASIMIAETDIKNEGHVESQTPVFTHDCIFHNTFHKDIYFNTGIGHKVQILFRGIFLTNTVKLPYYGQMAEFHEWFTLIMLSQLKSGNFIYSTEKGGCLLENEERDPIDKLIKRAFYVKRYFYATETGVFSTADAGGISRKHVGNGYKCLAIMALQYALQMIKKKEMGLAEDCLIYAEMMYLDIVDDAIYKTAVNVMKNEKNIDDFEAALKVGSLEPPKTCSLY